MKQLLIDLQQRLLTEVPELKYVDLDWGQLSYYFPNPPVQWPCDASATWYKPQKPLPKTKTC